MEKVMQFDLSFMWNRGLYELTQNKIKFTWTILVWTLQL
jgi:hypothetical protein